MEENKIMEQNQNYRTTKKSRSGTDSVFFRIYQGKHNYRTKLINVGKMEENKIIEQNQNYRTTTYIKKSRSGIDSFFFAFSRENRIMEHKGTVTLPYLCNLPFPFYNCGNDHIHICIF